MSPFLYLLLLSSLLSLSSADPPAIQDFCIPDAGAVPLKLTHLSTYPCRDPANVTGADFTFTGIRSMDQDLWPPGAGFGGLFVTPVQFPALHTLGMSFARADLSVGTGFNAPHYHPRSTETALIAAGTVYCGFVDSANRIYARIAEKGDVIVNPQGMIHFVLNVGDEVATLFGFFNSENPGGVNVGPAVFGSGVRDELLEKSFGLTEEEIERLKVRFGGGRKLKKGLLRMLRGEM